MQDELKKKEEEFHSQEEKLFSVCGSQNFDESLEAVKNKIDEAQNEKGALIGASHFFNKYIKKLRRTDPECPLCHRQFDGGDDAGEIIEELLEMLRSIPRKMETAEQAVNELQTKYDEMQRLIPLKKTMTKLETKEIPDLKTKLKTVNTDIEKLRSDIEEAEEDFHMKQGDQATAQSMHSDVTAVDRYQKELRDLEKRIAQQAAKLSGGDTGRTMQQVTNEKEDVQMKLETVDRDLERKRQKISVQSEHVQELKSEINELKAEKLKIEHDLQQRLKLEETKAELVSANQTYEREIQEAKKQLRPLATKMDQLKSEKDKIVSEKDEKVEAAVKEARDVEQKKNNVVVKQKEIAR